jgi:hypothetical protein
MSRGRTDEDGWHTPQEGSEGNKSGGATPHKHPRDDDSDDSDDSDDDDD